MITGGFRLLTPGLLLLFATNVACCNDAGSGATDITADIDAVPHADTGADAVAMADVPRGADAAVPDATMDALPETTGQPDVAMGSEVILDAAFETDAGGGIDYLDLSMRAQIAAMEEGKLTCVELVQDYLLRIKELDEGDDGINAILQLADDPVGAAGAIDGKAGSNLALHGAVIVLKDNIDTGDMVTTAGSLAMTANLPGQDAHVVGKLRNAGALILGKANLSEWANFRGYGSSQGWSSAGGQTRNGANPDYSPCGSSSGSAAAVAAGLVSAALGTETSGSIICPAAVNGVVGFKPTVGLVSRRGLVPISHSMDTAGTMTKTVGDAARLLSVMAGTDSQDPATTEIPASLSLDFEAGLDDATLDGLRLGVPKQHLGYHADLDHVFDREVKRLKAKGVEIVEVNIPSGASYGNDLLTVLLYEFKAGLNDYLASHKPAQVSSLAELIQFNQENAATVMPYFGQELFVLAQATTGLEEPEYLDALADVQATACTNGLLAVMAAENLDGFVSPTTAPAWKTNYATGDVIPGLSASESAACGMPHITVPMGDVEGLPVGISFFAGRWDDARVLQMAYAYEQM
jgi:amidase